MPTGIYTHQKHTKERCINMGNALRGKKRTNEIKIKMKENCVRGENHPRWKGEEVSNNVIHRYVEKIKVKTDVCEECGEKRRLNLASLTNHNYTRNPDDYKWLCYSCHKKMDLKCYRCKSNENVHLLMECDSCRDWRLNFVRLLKERLTNGFAYLSEEDTIAIINELAGNKLIEEKK